MKAKAGKAVCFYVFNIKALIFLYRQTIIVSILVKTHAIPESWEKYDLQEGLVNFLVVMEMLLFGVAHYFVFSYKPYVDPAAAQVPCIATCLQMLDLRDVAGDLKEHFVDPIPRPRFRITGRKGNGGSSEGGGASSQSTEGAPLLSKPNGVGVTGHVTNVGVAGHVIDAGVALERSALSELSYDVLTYKELDSRTAYGARARMIANACREVAEEEGEPGGEGREEGERTPRGSLSPNRELQQVAAA